MSSNTIWTLIFMDTYYKWLISFVCCTHADHMGQGQHREEKVCWLFLAHKAFQIKIPCCFNCYWVWLAGAVLFCNDKQLKTCTLTRCYNHTLKQARFLYISFLRNRSFKRLFKKLTIHLCAMLAFMSLKLAFAHCMMTALRLSHTCLILRVVGQSVSNHLASHHLDCEPS